MKFCILIAAILLISTGSERNQETPNSDSTDNNEQDITEKESRQLDSRELQSRCHLQFRGKLLEKRSLKEIAEFSEIYKRCLIGGSNSGK